MALHFSAGSAHQPVRPLPGPAVGALFQAEDVVAYTLAARLVAPALNTFSLHDVTAAVAEAIETAVGKGSRTGEQPPSSS